MKDIDLPDLTGRLAQIGTGADQLRQRLRIPMVGRHLRIGGGIGVCKLAELLGQGIEASPDVGKSLIDDRQVAVLGDGCGEAL